MLGLVSKSRLALAEARLVDAQNMLGRMETELHYWRERADQERMRADRIADADRVDRGLSEVSETVLTEKKAKSVQIDEELKEQRNELTEMFADNFDQGGEEDLNWIDPDLAEVARDWMAQAKQAREAKEKK